MRFFAAFDFGSSRLAVLLYILLFIVLIFSGLASFSFTASAAEPVLINTITRTGFSAGSFDGLGVGFHSAAFKFTPEYQYSLSAFEMNYYYGALGWTVRDGLDGAVLGNASTQITGGSGLPRWEFSPPVLLNPGTAYYLQSGGFAGGSLHRMPGNGGHFALGNYIYGLTDNGSGWISFSGGNTNYVSGGGDITFYGELLTKVFIDAPLMADPETGSFLHEGAALSKNNVKFEAMASTTLGASVKLQAEVRRSDALFTGISDGNIYESIFTSSPGYLAVVIPSLPNGEYHARLRSVDNLGNASDWREFGAPGNIDFTINFVSNTASALINVFNPSSGSRGSFTGLGYSVGAAAYSFTPDKDYTLTRFEMEYYDNGLSWNISSGLGGEIIATSSQTIPVSSIHKKWEFFGGVNLAAGTTYYLQTAGGFNSAGLLRLSGSGTTWTPGGVVYGRSDYNMLWNTFGNPIVPQNFLVGAGNGATVDFYGFSASAVAKNPVIIVPGIMGSRLDRVSDNENIWIGGSKILSIHDNYLDDLKLSTSGTQIIGGEINASEVLYYELGQSIYKNLLDELQNFSYASGTTLFQVPYDWRLDINSEAQKLGDAITTALASSTTGKVDIIAHSMGGLLVKQYLNQIGNSDFIEKIIFVGVPNLGAPKTFKALNYGDDFGIKKLGFGLNEEKVKEISQNMPAVYELLPSREYLNKTASSSYVNDFRSDGGGILNYNETSQFLAQNGRNQLLLGVADDFHEQIDTVSMSLASSTKFYTILGCQAPTATIGEFNIRDGDNYGIKYVDGDGTVPLLSSDSFSEATKKYYIHGRATGADHMGLVSVTSALELIKSLLAGDDAYSTDGISQNPLNCLDAHQSILISTHSPVILHIYDSQGKHIGPNADGDIELNIPDSNYDVIEHNSFAIVPAGVNYRVVLEATDSGKFDLDISSLSNFEVQNKLTYLDIPLQSATATATLSFADFSNPPALNLDNDGNGITDQVIQPTAILDAINSQDITPPVIHLPIFPDEIIYGTTTSLTFNAEDYESGVATSSATLNVLPVTNEQIVTFAKLGENLLRFKAKDFAGNPRVQEIKLNVVYNFNGFLPPVKPDNSGIYNQGKTLPVKFQLRDSAGNFISSAIATLSLSKITNGITGADGVALSTSKADTGNQFRYDTTDNQYIFNLSTDSLSPGTWQLKISLDDGKNYSVSISVK